jgi:preprotein translocase subunit SecD
VAPPSGNTSRPGLSLVVLAGLVVVLFLAIVGGGFVSPAAWSKDLKVQLGLDLTSGTTVSLLAVAPGGHPVTKGEMQQAIAIMLNRVNGAGFTEAQVQQQGQNVINVSVPGKTSQQVVKLVSKTAELQFRQVLLAASNTPTAVPSTTPTPVPTTVPTGSGSPQPSTGATPSASGSPSAAGLPGSGAGQNVEMARAAHNLRAGTASAAGSASSSPSASPSPSGSGSPSASASPSASPTPSTSTWQQAQGDPTLVSAATKALFNKLNCASKNWQTQVGYTNSQWNNPDIQIVACGSSGIKYALDKSKVVGGMISSAKSSPDPTTTSWQVLVNFKSNGTKAFGDLTSAMFAKYGNGGNPTSVLDQLAVVLDGTVVTAPTINGAIPGGQAQITGNFTQKSASTLANQLSYGALPLTFKQQSVQSVSPQLGHDQLHAGLVAAALGLILVVVYLLFYYRGLAIVSMSSLIIAATLSYESVIALGKYANFRLNLAGIAGLIVAIGITADSFVVFFERLRDEVRDGRTLRAAVERGWVRARRTILVSDTVSFLAAALLYYFAIGEVRGFAFTLGLTTIIDVIVVFTFTKPVLTLLARTRFFGGGHPLSGLDPERLGARVPWPGASRGAEPARRTGTGRTPTGRTGSGRTSPAKEA